MRKFELKSIEYNVVEHCNLRCAGCDHASPVLPKKFISLEEFEMDLQACSRYFAVGTLKLLGGEATLHPNLIDLMKTARSIGFFDRLCVITNGTALHKMKDDFWQLLDLLQVTFYPGVTVPIPRSELRYKAEQYGFTLELEDKRWFRNTIIDRENEDVKLIQNLYDACELRTTYACYTVRHGQFYKCSPSAFTKDRLSKLGLAFNDAQDFISLHAPNCSISLIEAYMASRAPIPSCSYCLGTCGTFFDQHQLTVEVLKEQKSVSIHPLDIPIATLIDFTHLEQRLANNK